LVNTYRRQELAAFQPSPVVFNHTIVRVNLEGQSFWLDPTANYERGLLTARSWPSYGLGLMVAPGVTGLTPIPPCPVQPKTTVTEYLNIGATLTAESTVKIVTVAEGRDADLLRERFATTARDDIERENLNNLAKLYPFIRPTQRLLYADDEQQNRVETTEFYAIERLWTRLPDETDYHARIYSVNVDQALIKPAVSFRAMPLGLQYPVHQIFHAEVYTTSGVPVDPINVRIENPAFYFQRTGGLAQGRLVLNFEYQSWTDVVAPDAAPAYVRDLHTATEALDYTVIGY
jgi:hypothetical protein